MENNLAARLIGTFIVVAVASFVLPKIFNEPEFDNLQISQQKSPCAEIEFSQTASQASHLEGDRPWSMG